ncbi:hypothetical protein NDU88_007334 [Pleurodeles waltl]|uniref:Uncharacterized protein n=1 Tax=Pleurodeles waltl TaxID=8319 RepID=A0AAV7SSF3_PLEWA|nr:hypothetical protein NDU88_007334 [Pleurodeles waltl]
MGARIDGEEDHSGDDKPPHPRPGHRIATPEILHHCKWTQQGQGQKRHMEHDLAGHHQPPRVPSRKRRTEASPIKLRLRSRRGQDSLPRPTFYLQEVSSRGRQRNGLPREVLQDMQTNRTRDEQMHREKGIEGRSPEDTRANQEKQPEGTAPQDHKSPGPDPEEEKRKPTVEPTTVTDPATPTETTVSVEPTRPEGTPKNGTPTNAPPLEAQGEPELTPETGAEEGKESMAAARTPTPAPAKSQKKNKHLKKKPDCSSGDEEEIKKAWKQVKSQRLREKCRKEKEERDERRRAQIKGRQSPP